MCTQPAAHLLYHCTELYAPWKGELWRPSISMGLVLSALKVGELPLVAEPLPSGRSSNASLSNSAAVMKSSSR